MKKIHDFNESVKCGDDGEYDIIEAWPHLFELYTEGDEYDLTVIINNKSFELKTEDGYTLQPGFPKPHVPTSTVNFFMETISNNRTMSVGGPFRALKDNVSLYGHLFPAKEDRVLFLFNDLEKLCYRCERLIAALPVWFQSNPCRVYNKRHVTIGYPLPIKSFSDLFVKIKLGENIDTYL